jgi:hypothetical protein
MADFIPRSDAETIAHGKSLTLYVTNHMDALGLRPGDETRLVNALSDFETKYNDSVTKKSEAEASIEEKDAAREEYEALLRAFNLDMHDAGDQHRAAMGLTVKDTVRTAVGAPDSHPVGEVETNQKLIHIIHFRDELTPDSKGKPDGVQGVQIWLKTSGAPPVDYKECQYVATDSRTPYNCNFEGVDAGKTAYYLLRWINGKGETGPWSPLIQATITG